MKKTSIVLLTSLLIGTAFPFSSFATEETKQSAETMVSNEEDGMKGSETTEMTSDTSTKTETTQSVEVSEVIPKIEEGLNQLIGEKKGEDVPIYTSPTASQIRETLLADDYGVTKEELAKYTDEQLEQTMTLFTRYNEDVSGMDYGSYARLLKTLFDSQTVNANDALTQLAFNPGGFTSFSSMIPEVEKLKVYLDTLYPVNSSFLPGLGLSSAQLVERLTSLQLLEDQLKAEGKTLPFGRIAGLISTDIAPTKETEETTNSTTQEKIKESQSKEATTNKNDGQNKKDDSLPKTGEASNSLGLIGLGVLGLLTLIAIPLKNKF